MPNSRKAARTVKAVNQPFVRGLRRGQCLNIQHPRQLCLRAERGTLWITVDGQLDDIQLDAGQSRVFDGRIKVLVSTLGGDAIVSATPLPRRTALPAGWGRWIGWLVAAPRVAVLA
ncbi:MAG TPA: DUF2917 domain-containing protein [Rubrivivax sp.]|nr:DUF2917 domain-containing protein [Rubrivivax sp.]